jgi:cytochrome bd-type quinol oxidase subunit 2
MEALDKARPLISIGLIGVAAFVCYKVFAQYQAASWRPQGHPWILLAHLGTVIALCALAARWAKPEWKKTSMTVALLSALLAFAFGRQVG